MNQLTLKYKSYLLFLLFFCSIPVFSSGKKEVWNGNIYTTEIQGNKEMIFVKARYSLFIPKECEYIRGILIHQHGCTMEGTGAPIITDAQYQAFAKKWNLALLGPDMYPHGKECTEWADPCNGSEKSLLMALDSLSIISKHKELADAPWLLWGHSGGGHWVLSMFSRYPEKTLAVVGYSAAFDQTFVYSRKAAQVPVFLRHAGKNDRPTCSPTALNQFSTLKKMNGWVSIVNNEYQDENHNLSNIRLISIPFFESVLSRRLPQRGECKLRNLNIYEAWLGDTTLTDGVNLYREIKYEGDKSKLSRLPDSIFAAKYREYSLTGTVRDTTPPPVPYSANISSQPDGNFEICWMADADIESGISHFMLYKNGSPWKRFPEKEIFQTYNRNGDEPIPHVAPEMKMQITKEEYKPSDVFSISTVNGEELESSTLKIERIPN